MISFWFCDDIVGTRKIKLLILLHFHFFAVSITLGFRLVAEKKAVSARLILSDCKFNSGVWDCLVLLCLLELYSILYLVYHFIVESVYKDYCSISPTFFYVEMVWFGRVNIFNFSEQIIWKICWGFWGAMIRRIETCLSKSANGILFLKIWFPLLNIAKKIVT